MSNIFQVARRFENKAYLNERCFSRSYEKLPDFDDIIKNKKTVCCSFDILQNRYLKCLCKTNKNEYFN